MPNMNQDNETVYIGKDGKHWPVTLNEFNEVEKRSTQLLDNNNKRNALINKLSSAKMKKTYVYMLFDMLAKGLTDKFIGETFFSDSMIPYPALNALSSAAFLMGEEFAEQFIGTTFTHEDITKAITDKVLSENADKVQENAAASPEEQERIKKLNDDLASAREKISDNEKNIQVMQTEHDNMISYLKQQITEIKELYDKLNEKDSMHQTELSNKDLQLNAAKLSEAEAKKDAEINKLTERIDYNDKIHEMECQHYEEKIKAKDDEIKSLKARIDGGNIEAYETDMKKDAKNPPNENGQTSEQNISEDDDGPGKHLFGHAPLPKGDPDRKFSRREARKRKEILFDALQYRSNDQCEAMADAYARGLPYKALERMYNWENASKLNMLVLERALLEDTFNPDY